MNWSELDWDALERLRDGFLSGRAAQGPYWTSRTDLANYDLTYGERIGWKWDAVLSELKARRWSPPPGTLLDWGCGSGVAGRRVLRAFGTQRFDTLEVWDHSSLARDFARDAACGEFPALPVAIHDGSSPAGTLVLSHVLNELSPEARRGLLALIRQASAVIWVEPGTHAVSRDLIGLRETLRDEFRVVAPCTHSASCGLLAVGNERHWCHAFAPPPANIYADSQWVKFGQRAGIDLRSLPYSFLVLERTAATPTAPEVSRIIGDPRHFKGYAKLLSCDASGVTELTLQKRAAPELFKQLKRGVDLPIFRWTRVGDSIQAGTPAYPLPETAAGQSSASA